VIILGESYYERDPNNPLTPGFTNLIVQKHAECEWRLRFYTKAAVVLLGKRPWQQELWQFWHSVAHYTFIQVPVGRRRSAKLRDAERR